MPASLTARQAAIYQFLRGHLLAHGRPPTLREVMAAFGFAAPNSVSAHLRALTKKGYLRAVRREGRRQTTYVPAVPEVVAEPVPGGVRVATTGPVVLSAADWRAWLAARLAELEAA